MIILHKINSLPNVDTLDGSFLNISLVLFSELSTDLRLRRCLEWK